MAISLVFILSSCCAALSPPPPRTRRAVLGGALTTTCFSCRQPAPAFAADAFTELRARLEAPLVTQLSTAPMAGREPSLPAEWLVGRWSCEQTLQRYSTPQGVQYIGAAGRPLVEAEASAAQTRQQIGVPVNLELRWRASPGGAVEDRAYNVRSRLDAFAGRRVVRQGRTCADAGVDSPGVACSFIDFTGPIAQKTIVNAVRVAAPASTAEGGGTFISSELTRTILARRKAAGDTRERRIPTRDLTWSLQASSHEGRSYRCSASC